MTSEESDTGPVFFWRPEAEDGFLGQWYPAPFTWRKPVDGNEGEFEELHYQNAEQYMMHRKALLFAPSSPITAQILAAGEPAPHPRVLKQLGRQVPNFSENVWNNERMAIVLEGNMLKFSQNDELREKLLATGERELVEASPRDRIWGVGYEKANAEKNRYRWGLNLLGKCLMETRSKLREQKSS
ncbi:hypothetical protein BGW36DRAFT_298041 [Talaromyces proteolyticus]|uniref:NADAR domain-containing protein n=1 Tax=Talaromyces proteolyticus TaxID=1131652 RepID=A0AAD4KQX5_9EURO|nr:uncharacterized protein BGW36DRAFT_298041 [Talaromyces proteolyticus]KAH8696317.1 hypothetical protein BGW36DRAFT_298041 [Talaromyces proteolyticus]